MSWIYLAVAGAFEVVWVLGMKYTDGFTRIIPTLITIIGMVASVYFLHLAEREIPVGTAYAVWTGIGVIGSVIGGMYLFGESRDFIRLLFLAMILGGIVGLKIST
ncbi:DMT family transporter [Dendrosporobacter sp. 1207_IL3150]|uniref:DMT family transporter n=1 Tax=Dendrosporobacter sp. 1207_IL3150 TaxID=3084054 RepID=UPI002FD9074B